MKSLNIEGNSKHPAVEFNSNGDLNLSGRSIPEDPERFYDTIYLWLYDYCKNPAPLTHLNVKLDYFNSGSTKTILNLLRQLIDMAQNNHSLVIDWYYEEGDEDILERGEDFESILEFKFNYITY